MSNIFEVVLLDDEFGVATQEVKKTHHFPVCVCRCCNLSLVFLSLSRATSCSLSFPPCSCLLTTILLRGQTNLNKKCYWKIYYGNICIMSRKSSRIYLTVFQPNDCDLTLHNLSFTLPTRPPMIQHDDEKPLTVCLFLAIERGR